MTILNAAWNELGFNLETPSSNVVTTAGRYDSVFSRAAFGLSTTYSLSLDALASVSEAWFHFSWYNQLYNSSAGGPYTLFTWRSVANGQDQIRLISTYATGDIHRWSLQKWNGSWTTIVTTPTFFAMSNSTLLRVDIRVKFHASLGEIQVYVNEALVLTFSGDTSTTHNVFDRIIMAGTGSSGSDIQYISECFIADDSTVGKRLFTMYPTGSGAQSDFNGAYTDIDDLGAVDNTDFVVSDTVGHISQFALNDIPGTYNKYTVVAVVAATALAISPDATIADLQIAYRNAGGTNFFSSSTGYTHDSVVRKFQEIRHVSPFTSLAWSFSEVNGLQLGVKAV